MSKGKYRKYNKEKLLKSLDLELAVNNVSIFITNNEDFITVFPSGSCSGITVLYFMLKNYKEKDEKILEQLIERYMVNNNAIVAFMCSSKDNHFQNTSDLDDYIRENKSLDGVKTTIRKYWLHDKIVDIEYNPGHSHSIYKIWFGSCYLMWFGKKYYQYISKEKLLNFNNCYEKSQLQNDVIRIKLYEDMFDYEKPSNRQKQWEFRKSVGIDEQAHILEDLANHNRGVSDPAIEINTVDGPHGGTRMMIYYLDENEKNVAKSEATYQHCIEMDEAGKVLYKERKKL